MPECDHAVDFVVSWAARYDTLLLIRLTPEGVVFSLTLVTLLWHAQAVGPVAVTSLLLGSGLKDTITSPVQADPNNPANPAAQMEYNMAAIQVCLSRMSNH